MGGSDHRRKLKALIREMKLTPRKEAEELALLLSKLVDDEVAARTVRSWIDETATRRCPGWPVAILKYHLKLK